MVDPPPYRKILVPLDFSSLSLRALDHALALAEGMEAAVVLLTVVDTSFPYPDLYSLDDPDREYFKTMRDRALQRMSEALAARGPLRVETEKLVGRGRPRLEIPAIATEIGADLMVLMARSGGALRSALLGSTTEAIVRHAPCPVLVLPVPPEAEAEAEG